MRMRGLLSGLAVACALTGCSAAAPSPGPTTPPAGASAVDGVSLKQLGFQHGPDALRLPAGTKLKSAIDQENVVTLFFIAPGSDALLAHLRKALPAAGLRITSDANGALLFEGSGWSGSCTTGADGVPALTLRVV